MIYQRSQIINFHRHMTIPSHRQRDVELVGGGSPIRRGGKDVGVITRRDILQTVIEGTEVS